MQYFVQMIIRRPVMTTTLVVIFVLGIVNIPLTATPPEPKGPWAPEAPVAQTIADAQDIREQTWHDRLAMLVDPVVDTARAIISLTPRLPSHIAATAAAGRGTAAVAAPAAASAGSGAERRKESLVLKAQPG